MVCIGDMVKSLIIQRRISTPDNYGGFDTSWVDFRTLRCKLSFKSGGERLEYQGINAYRGWIAEAMYVSGITTIHRALLGSRVFNIKYVENVSEKSIFMRLYLEERMVD